MVKSIPASEKEAYVERLFSSIAPRYDLLNSVLSFRRHRAWRRFAVTRSGLNAGGRALDVCCGTGDFALELARAVGPGGRVVGTDFSVPMIELAVRKAAGLGGGVAFLAANACALPFADGSFDCATVGFGLRNVADVARAVREMARVVRPGGRVVCLEISHVRLPLVAWAWKVYFMKLSPYLARLFRGRWEAYSYLPESVRGFISREELAEEFARAGLESVSFHDLTLGTVCVHVGTKPS